MKKDSVMTELEKERAARIEAEQCSAILLSELDALKKAAPGGNDTNTMVTDANNRLLQLIAHLQHGILLIDEQGKILVTNDLFCRQFDIDTEADELIGKNSDDLLNQIIHRVKHTGQFAAGIKKLIEARTTVLRDEIELVNGQVFLRDYIPVFSGNDYKGHLWKFTDVTRDKTIEATFDAQQRFYEQILNNTPADIIVCTSEYQYLYVNPTAVKDATLRKWMIGKTVEEYYQHVKRLTAEAIERRKFFNKVKELKTEQETEEQSTDTNGNITYQLRKMFPVLNEQGEVEMMISYGVDITERKKIDEQIKVSEKRYREIFNFSKAWICTHDLLGTLLTINPAACNILDYTEEELLGRNLESLLPERYQAEFTEVYMNNIISYGKAEGIMKILNRKKKDIYLLYQNYLVNEPDSEPYIIGFAQNITERIYAEEALKRSKEKYRSIIENMNLGMIEIDQEERIKYANQRFCTMSGYDLNELLTKKATDLFLQGASLKKTKTQLSKGKYGITNNYELAVKTKSGEERWWLTSAAPVFDGDKQVQGTIGIHLDITEQRKLAEQLREAKLKADRLTRSKDTFLTNMSHEIRTPLNAIMGLSKLLVKDKLTDKQKNYLSGIESASGSLLAIINDLLDLSKIESGKITIEHISFSMSAISKQVISMLTHKAEEKGLNLTLDIDKEVAPVYLGDPYRVNQVFMNMLSNAIKFTEKGSVSLAIRLLKQQEKRQDLKVVIKDTGIGIKEEYLKKLFDKFSQEDETVERKFGGTGLGMNITRQLMDLMGGTIAVESEKNKGTTVTLTFSFEISTEKISDKKGLITVDSARIKGSRILLVEDNHLNRLLAYTILTDYGALVREAEDGEQALELLRNEQFDIVLMDIQMPVLDGMKATEIIRNEISKTIPILALTANVVKGKEEQFLSCGMNDFILKPYNEANLINPIVTWLSKGDVQTSDNTETPVDNMSNEISDMEDKSKQYLPQDNAPLYDLSKLMGIARNDDTFIIKMLQLFTTETALGLIKLNEAYEAGDMKNVKYYAHRMKPSIGNLGIICIKDEVLDIEFAVEKSEEVAGKLDKVNFILNKVMEQMKSDYDLS